MPNHIATSSYGEQYEIVGRGSRPTSSCAVALPHWSLDYISTRSLVAHLNMSRADWCSLLIRMGISVQPNIYTDPAMWDAITTLCLRGYLSIYKLPKLSQLPALSAGGGIGYCFVPGPKPHTYADLTPEKISNLEEAKALLGRLKANEGMLVDYVGRYDLLRSLFQFDGNITLRFTELLAKGEILAYKIHVNTNTPPKPQGELVSATGPMYQPVTDLPPPAKTSAAPKNSLPEKKPEPQSLDEAAQRLKDAKPAVDAAKAAGKSLPSSNYSHTDKQAVIESGVTERFMVRVIPTNRASDDGYIAPKREHGATIGWMAPLSMVEHGDTDAGALLNAFGTRHNPKESYTVLIIDTQKMDEVADVKTIIPTNKNLQQLMADNPQITKVSPDIAKQVLNKDFAPKYYKFTKGMNAAGTNQTKAKDMESFALDQGFSKKESDLLAARHQLAKDVSAWEEFTGNGMTLDTNVKGEIAYGPVELVMLDKSPKTLGELKNKNAILSLAAN